MPGFALTFHTVSQLVDCSYPAYISPATSYFPSTENVYSLLLPLPSRKTLGPTRLLHVRVTPRARIGIRSE